jgi:hypothetical protein
MECSAGKISRVETASVGVRIADVRHLLDIYNVHGLERERMFAMVRVARKRTSWWHEHAGTLSQDTMRYLGLEDAATLIDEYSGSLIPSLLQADGYSGALLATATNTDTPVEPARTAMLHATLRAQRRHLLTRDSAPRLRYVLDEAALAVRFGGPTAMADQLDSLLTVVDRPNVTLQVMPLGAEAFAAAGGPFTMFTFATPDDDPSTVYVSGRTFCEYREDTAEVDQFRSDFAELLQKAHDVPTSAELIRYWAGVHRASATGAAGNKADDQRETTWATTWATAAR